MAGEASAQSPVVGQLALDRYEPTPVGDSFYSVDGGQVHGHLIVRGGLTFDYAHNPLVLRTETCTSATHCTDSGTAAGAIVGNQLFAHLGLSLALWDRLLISASLPVAFVDAGDTPKNPNAPATVFTSPNTAAVGDLKLGARARSASPEARPRRGAPSPWARAATRTATAIQPARA